MRRRREDRREKAPPGGRRALWPAAGLSRATPCQEQPSPELADAAVRHTGGTAAQAARSAWRWPRPSSAGVPPHGGRGREGEGEEGEGEAVAWAAAGTERSATVGDGGDEGNRRRGKTEREDGVACVCFFFSFFFSFF